MRACLALRRGTIMFWTIGWCATTSKPPIAHAEMLEVQGLLSAQDLKIIREALTAIGEEHARGVWQVSLEQEDCQTAIENLLTARIGATTGGRLHAGRSRNDQVLAALRLYMRDAAAELQDGARAAAAALDELAMRHGPMVLPGYTHMQQAMPSTVELWAQGFAAEIRDDAEGLALTQRRIGKNPLGSAAGYGTPNLELSREETRRRLGFAVTQEPVTAVQLSRGKAEAELLCSKSRCSHRTWDVSPPTWCSLHARIRLRGTSSSLYHRLVDHAAKAQSGCVRTGARTQRGRTRRAQRSAWNHSKAELRISSGFAVDQAAFVPHHRFLSADP